MKAARLGALVALVAAMAMPTALARELATAKNIEKQCKAVSTCVKGGGDGVTCTIATETCPVCVTFENNGCFEILTTGKCPFGDDCTNYWKESSGTSSGSGDSGKSGTSTSSGSNGGTTHSSSTGVASNSTSSHTNSSSSSNSTSNKDSTTKSSGTDMTVVFGIVGAAIGVIAVAVIFLVLVRRSRAAEEDDEEMTATPQAMGKSAGSGPSTTTNAAAYAPYAQRAPPANPTTPTNRVIKYYNDNAQPSPHGGRGGGFGSQPVPQGPVKTVRPAAAANAPTFFKQPSAPLAQAVPAPPPPPPAQPYQEYQPQPPPQYQPQPPPQPVAPTYQEHNYHTQMSSGQGGVQYPQAEPLFTVHTGPDEPQVVRRVSSPRPRRESYEF